MTPLASIAVAACLAIGAGTDHILLQDLAPAFPGLETVASDRPVALAPAPGVQRVFHVPELRRLATQFGIVGEPQSELCFERRAKPLEPAQILEAMRRQLPESEIEILEYSKLPAPDGELEFPLAGLRQTLAGGFWSGAVRYAGRRRYLVWAKVKVLNDTARVIATADVKAGQAIDASQLRVEIRTDFPADRMYVTSLEQAAGKTLTRPVTAGTVLRSEWLIAPKDVTRGEIVDVDVWSGRTHLRLPAVAEASGSTGETIPVRNTESRKRFWAQVVGKGKVSVGKAGL